MFGFQPYDSKNSRASEGKRLAVVRYKNTAKQKAKFSNICANVPKLSEVPVVSGLMPHMVALIESAQDGIIRDLHESGKTMVSDSQISIESCIAWLDSAADGERLKKEDVIEWFNESVQETLTVALADKLGVSDVPSKEEETRIAAMLEVYRAKFASLAGGKTSYSPEVATKLVRVLELIPADEVSTRFTVRLNKMAQETAADMLAL